MCPEYRITEPAPLALPLAVSVLFQELAEKSELLDAIATLAPPEANLAVAAFAERMQFYLRVAQQR